MNQAAIAGRHVLKIAMGLARQSNGSLGVFFGFACDARSRGRLNTTDLMESKVLIGDLS